MFFEGLVKNSNIANTRCPVLGNDGYILESASGIEVASEFLHLEHVLVIQRA